MNLMSRCLKYFLFIILSKLLELILFVSLAFICGENIIRTLGFAVYLLLLTILTGIPYIVLGFYLFKHKVLSKAIIVISFAVNIFIYLLTLLWLNDNFLAEEHAYKYIPFSIYTGCYTFNGLVSHGLGRINFLTPLIKDVIVSVLAILYTHLLIITGGIICKRQCLHDKESV